MVKHRWAVVGATLSALALAASPARADSFAAGSLIIPMDVDYQDVGMLEAYGLVYALLLEGVPVRWVIKTDKAMGDVDLTATAVDLRSDLMIEDHGYRGGPWVIDAADVEAALPVIDAWLADNPDTNVHSAMTPFDGDVARTLIAAPTIAMMADGNQKIARKYMQAAKIPDSTGDPLWPDSSPDMLTPEEVTGPTLEDHRDGQLFDDQGYPAYCQFMSMHWGVKDALDHPGAVAEVRAFLNYPTHFYAQCQAVNAFENHPDHGFFLTEKGFLIGQGPNSYDFFQSHEPYAQLDGPFESVGGSEPAYSLPEGANYKASDIVMITEQNTPVGVNDVWMTGTLDGLCPASGSCLTTGKVSYLGGHEYDVKLPISANPKTQGTRLFLNSLFEAPCATAEGQPKITIEKEAPRFTSDPAVTFVITYTNNGPLAASNVVIHDPIPAGATLDFMSPGGVEVDGVVSWEIGSLAPSEGGKLELGVLLGDYGTYTNTATFDYTMGLNLLSVASNQTMTEYLEEGDSATTGDPETTGGDSATGGSATGGSATGGSAGETSGGSSEGGETGGGETATNETSATGGASNEELGCGCRGGGAPGGPWVWSMVALVALRQRREGAQR